MTADVEQLPDPHYVRYRHLEHVAREAGLEPVRAGGGWQYAAVFRKPQTAERRLIAAMLGSRAAMFSVGLFFGGALDHAIKSSVHLYAWKAPLCGAFQ